MSDAGGGVGELLQAYHAARDRARALKRRNARLKRRLAGGDSERARAALERIAADPDVSDRVRDVARRGLGR